MNFCNYCECYRCKFGEEDLYHAKTSNGDWICEVCYQFALCTTGNLNGPCEDWDCIHRPKIIGKWKLKLGPIK